MKSVLWITWEEQRRNKPIADEIGAKYYEITDTLGAGRLKRYALNFWKTLRIIMKEKPSAVVAQNPSIVLALQNVILGKILGYKSITDTHNGGFGLPSDVDNKYVRKASLWAQRHADVVIAHNDQLKERIKDRGGNIIALPDKIPEIPRQPTKELDGKYNFLFISSFAVDEPWENVIEAFTQLGSRYHVYITGNYAKKNINPNDYPENIHFTGRIPWDEFDIMLYSADAVLDLTKRDDCLLCGAYESTACGTPMILTGTDALRTYFNKGASYTDNSVGSLKVAVLNMCEHYFERLRGIKELKPELEKDWKSRVQNLINVVR